MRKQLVGEINYIKLWRKRIKKTSGTVEGGRKAAATNKKRNGEDFFKRIGAIGGRNGHTGGFCSMTPEQRSECGRKGGRISKRGKAKKEEDEDF